MDHREAVTRLLDAAEALFYERGVQAVGMDEIRATSQVSLKRFYQCFPSKEHLVEAYLRRRDKRWLAALADHVTHHATTRHDRLPAVFDWLHDWFSEPTFRGCAFINSFGELGATSELVANVVREHKDALRQYLLGLVDHLDTDNHAVVADQLLLLVDGAITVAAITGNPDAALHGRTAAETLLTAFTNGQCDPRRRS